MKAASRHDQTARWLDRVRRDAGPVYLALADALAAAIREGELQPGDRLPPQRDVAQRLGLDLTTVTRAYAVARDRGLLESTVGRGAFVRARAADDEAGLVDLTMNLPPPPEGVSLARLLEETAAAVLRRTDPAALMAYHPGAGALGQRAAGAAWLAPVLGEVPAERVLVAAGAQAALCAVLSTVARPGDTVVTEPLTYPGVRTAAAELGLTLAPCPVDADGVRPDALDRLCREARPRALYVVPTMQNPTAGTMPDYRRREVAAVATAHGLALVEDDPYSRLLEAPPPALAQLAPDLGYHIATLAKTLSPGLRLAYVVAPPGMASAVEQSLRALTLMPAPLMAAVVTSWMREGQAEALLAGVRKEALARRAIAAEVLPAARGAPESLHVWLDLPETWSPDRVRAAAQGRGLALVTAEAFAVGDAHPNGLRISLGGPGKRAVLQKALAEVAALSASPSPTA
ncbi:PLP-dependent aminotransferase family protein [Phenylobacterium sp. J367]|uniref:aminotransferase-like domain-containing protein n=1 Tax=Phenylobacterium sp. J367 TaxID=2898435 RepID=UPI0021515F21|nr:PLP-dependent aminotransferase family protein [Phenylobacterium sp. J367]MCR5877386.1 PLP-dependent aminotransferase family protein [Phenylobacterium sp. J367]